MKTWMVVTVTYTHFYLREWLQNNIGSVVTQASLLGAKSLPVLLPYERRVFSDETNFVLIRPGRW